MATPRQPIAPLPPPAAPLELREARILRLEPGDTVIYTSHEQLSDRECDDLTKRLAALFPDNPIIITTRGEIAVARPVDPQEY